MTMHLVGPYLSTTGKSRQKKKFRTAEEARRHRELTESWVALKAKWGAPTGNKTKKAATTVDLPTVGKPLIRTSERPPSLSSWNVGAVCSKEVQQYTGNNMIGISTLHKSNAVPVFSQTEAEEIAKMRR